MSTTADLEKTPQQAKADAVALLPKDTKDQATMLVASGVFPSMKSVGQAVVAVELGRSLGLPPAQAMAGISIVEGRPFIGANILARAVKLHEKYDYRVIEHDAEHCKIDFYEIVHGERELIGVSEYSIEEARAAGAKFKSQKGNNLPWTSFPKNMLFARALSNGVKWFCPDAVGTTVYVNEERDLIRQEQAIEQPPEPKVTIIAEQAQALAEHATDILNDSDLKLMLTAYGAESIADLTPDAATAFGAELSLRKDAAKPVEPVEGELIDEEAVVDMEVVND